ncbi:MAG: hypothetical protein Ct9H300mP6_12680 [Gammaproteobacteria bacterium]|nr:MAG: hypothetical protein Ct9H300mP6_12680 [Gammaproteobacteria bacterium]
MHVDEFVRGKGQFIITDYVPTTETANRRFPLLLTTGRNLVQYNVGTQLEELIIHYGQMKMFWRYIQQMLQPEVLIMIPWSY